MVLYNFKKIQVVPTGKDFVDIVLSRTQRKTPTVIHKSYPINAIRKFYMRKVKYTQQTYHDKLSQIIQDFPLLDDIHPFYADLINVLYDRDHYKLALGQLNTVRRLIDNLAKDYVRLLKYSDSLYRSKQLKRAALGRMCTLMRKLAPSLGYLEQVRQHLARLPSIDPNTRTLIICGYPNVGKSSFMNKLTRANVDVQPYAFTTKSLFVGHMDYQYIRWQVIDTPGILDHPLEDRNTIEMQSITALAHLNAAVLFFVDISEQCGYTIPQQVALFESIKPLFFGKPLIVVVNKIDLVRPEKLESADSALIYSLADPTKGGIIGTKIIPMSAVTEEGVSNVKQIACDALLEARVGRKLASAARGGKEFSRLHLATPTPRDSTERPAFIPPSVVEARSNKVVAAELTDHERAAQLFEDRIRADDEENALWAAGKVPGTNSTVWKERYQLKNPEWRLDPIPEIMDGKNIADFIDPDILELLDELEREEEQQLSVAEAEEAIRLQNEESDLDDDTLALVDKIRKKKHLQSFERNLTRSSRRTPHKHQVMQLDDLSTQLVDMGYDEKQAAEATAKVAERSRSRSRGTKRGRDESTDGNDSAKKKRSASRSVSRSLAPADGFKSPAQKDKAGKMAKKAQAKLLKQKSKKLQQSSETDRSIYSKMPRHLFSGKRGLGKTDRR